MELCITEHKSVDTLNPWNDTVRVFVDGDFNYGYFVREHRLFELLTAEQQVTYLQGRTAKLDVSIAVAQAVVDMGATPFKKPVLAKPLAA
jgi:hypothetical protein